MEELSIEEKAKAYDEAIERAKEINREHSKRGFKPSDDVLYVFPELKESEDERIRKWCISHFKECINVIKDNDEYKEYLNNKVIPWLEKHSQVKEFPISQHENKTCKENDDSLTSEDERIKEELINNFKEAIENIRSEEIIPHSAKVLVGKMQKWIAWLEKQGGQDNVEDVDILQRFSFYSYKDEPNILYLSGLYVNEEYRNKGIGTKILEVADEVAKSLNCHAIRLKTKKDSNAERLYRTHGYNSLAIEDEDEIWLEKQGEQKPANNIVAIWKDMRLEVGAQASGNRHEPQYSDNSTKLFSLNDIDEIIEKISEKQGEQKSDDEVKAKQNSELEKGKWYVCDIPRYKDFIVGKAYYCPKNEMLKLKEDELPRYVAKYCFHLWTIEDVKDGDVLYTEGFYGGCIFIFNGLDKWKFDEPNGYRAVATGYCCLFVSDDKMEFGIQGPDCVEVNTIKPATKEQRGLLFQKMKEAGYKWDSEKKELKKIEQNSAWSEEDERMINSIIKNLDEGEWFDIYQADWLKSLKNRVQPQSKQEWSEDDKEALRVVTNIFEQHGIKLSHYPAFVHWLKVLPNRITLNPYWKPSDEQIKGIECAIKTLQHQLNVRDNRLNSLYDDLKKLK